MNNFLDKTSRAAVSLARMALSLAIISWAAVGIQDSVSYLFGRKKKVVVCVEKTTTSTNKEEESKEEPKKATSSKKTSTSPKKAAAKEEAPIKEADTEKENKAE